MKINKILLYAIIATIIIFISIFILAFSDGNKCISNPLTYGANKISNEETGKFSCICSFENPKYEQIYFNETDVITFKDYLD